MPRPTWIQTYCGHKFDFANLAGNVYDLRDVAHSLSMQCRFGGHCIRFYSVAEHCLLMHDAFINSEPTFSPLDELHILLHDAGEAYIHDIVSPLKTGEASELERQILIHLHDAIGLPLPTEAESRKVHEYDTRILVNEVEMLMLQDSLKEFAEQRGEAPRYPVWDHLPAEGLSFGEGAGMYAYARETVHEVQVEWYKRVKEALGDYKGEQA